MLSRLAIEGADGDVERLLVVGHARLGPLGGRRAFGRLALDELPNRGRIVPHRLIEIAVDDDRRGQRHGHRVERGRDGPLTPAVALLAAVVCRGDAGGRSGDYQDDGRGAHLEEGGRSHTGHIDAPVPKRLGDARDQRRGRPCCRVGMIP